MKKINAYLKGAAAVIVACLLLASCQKNGPELFTPNPPPPNPPVNTLPLPTGPISYKVNAGFNQLVELPINNAVLWGSLSSTGNSPQFSKNTRVKWAKITGPNSYLLENEDSLRTKVSNLVEGTYLFELTITDSLIGLHGKDTLLVIVGKLPSNPTELIFKDIPLICEWYCGWDISNLSSRIPINKFFKIFIQWQNTSQWNEVKLIGGDSNDEYQYWIEDRPDGGGMYKYENLYILWFPTSAPSSWAGLRTADIKIAY